MSKICEVCNTNQCSHSYQLYHVAPHRIAAHTMRRVSTHEPDPVTCKLRKHYYLVCIYAISQTKGKKLNLSVNTQSYLFIFLNFHYFHQTVNHLSIDAHDQTNLFVHKFPSILDMKYLSIVHLQEAYSISRCLHPCNAFIRAIQSKSKLQFLSNGRDKAMAYLL